MYACTRQACNPCAQRHPLMSSCQKWVLCLGFLVSIGGKTARQPSSVIQSCQSAHHKSSCLVLCVACPCGAITTSLWLSHLEYICAFAVATGSQAGICSCDVCKVATLVFRCILSTSAESTCISDSKTDLFCSVLRIHLFKKGGHLSHSRVVKGAVSHCSRAD